MRAWGASPLSSIIPAVSKKTALEDLSVEQLRYLLMEKRRRMRHDKLEHFRRTGRVVMLASDTSVSSLETLRSGSLADIEQAIAEANPRSRVRRILDIFLLIVEVSAVIGLVLVLLNGLDVLRSLNKEFAIGLAQPTLTPTPLIQEVVLPGGHTPPNAAGGSTFNEAEIPEHLRPLVQSLASAPTPTPGPEQAIRIQIPAINVDYPIVQGDGPEQLRMGVGQHIGSVNPGQVGNIILTGHDDIFGEVFRYLKDLKPGDLVIVFTNQKSYTYVVMSEPEIVEPTRVEVMGPSSEPIVTLISCYPYRIDNKRIIVRAYLQSGSK